jgi:hypothetical protein
MKVLECKEKKEKVYSMECESYFLKKVIGLGN